MPKGRAEGTAKRPTKEEVLRSVEESDLDRDQVMRILRRDLPWKDWLVSDYLRYWYAVGSLALDAFLLMGLADRYHMRDPLGLAMLAGVGLALVASEVAGYMVIWPENALTRSSRLSRYMRKRRRERRGALEGRLE